MQDAAPAAEGEKIITMTAAGVSEEKDVYVRGDLTLTLAISAAEDAAKV